LNVAAHGKPVAAALSHPSGTGHLDGEGNAATGLP
jgi:hypothetical protein